MNDFAKSNGYTQPVVLDGQIELLVEPATEARLTRDAAGAFRAFDPDEGEFIDIPKDWLFMEVGGKHVQNCMELR